DMACSLRWILTAFFIQAAYSLHQNGLLSEDQYQMALCVKSIAVQNFPPGRMVISLPDTIPNPSTHKLSLEQRDNDNFAFADFVFKLMNEVMRWNLKSFIPSDDATNVRLDYILQYRDEIPQYHIVLAWSYDEEGDIIEIITYQIIAMIVSFSTNQRGRFLLVIPVIIPAKDGSIIQSKGLTDSSYPTFDVYTWFPFQSPVTSAESIVLLNQWLGINEGGFIHNRDLYPNKIPRSFGGRKISVVPVVYEPLSWLKGNYTDEDGETNYNITGPEFDLLQIVCDELDLHISYEPVNTEVIMSQQKERSRESSAYMSISSCLYNMWAVHLGVSVTDMPRTTILRALFIMCVWYAYAMGNLFQIYFTSFLVDPGLEKAVTNTEEYLDANLHLKYNVDTVGTSQTLFTIYRLKVWDMLRFERCIKEIFNNKNYSTISFEHWMEYYAKVNYPRRETKICFLSDRQNVRPYTIFLRRGSPYLESFNRMVHRVLQSGIMAHFMKK
ncbi:hypothetical protein ANN_16823, partial [Periplaneta americana]